MHTLSKNRVGNAVLLDYIAQKQVLVQKIAWLERKYGTDFRSFEKKVEEATDENFTSWDDYIEWKALEHFLSEILVKIEDIKHGHFQMA
jgi:flagellar biosynthesis/type III secretory pathway chaperone